MADPSGDQPHDDGPELPLDFTELSWASPPVPPIWSPAGPRRGCAAHLGHVGLTTTTTTCTTDRPGARQPVTTIKIVSLALSAAAFTLSLWAAHTAFRARQRP
ncbi:hypothetical protein [Kitasatospora xanthocidica]|uniref:hypothetical protein n=1 Tax=Kitasatospora xanthocidica TaxID=83382 RepID=UPI0011C4AB71|nr:hypothetical protein [Kitasatospora xanthocidica]